MYCSFSLRALAEMLYLIAGHKAVMVWCFRNVMSCSCSLLEHRISPSCGYCPDCVLVHLGWWFMCDTMHLLTAMASISQPLSMCECTVSFSYSFRNTLLRNPDFQKLDPTTYFVLSILALSSNLCLSSSCDLFSLEVFLSKYFVYFLFHPCLLYFLPRPQKCDLTR